MSYLIYNKKIEKFILSIDWLSVSFLEFTPKSENKRAKPRAPTIC